MKRIDKKIIQLAMLILIVNGQVWAKDPGINAFYKGDYKKAGDYYDARLNKDKENEKIMYNSGTAALAQKDLEKANSLLMQSLATDNEKQLAKAHYNLGQLSLEQQNTEEALAHFMKSMIYDPEDPNSKIMYEHIKRMQQGQQQEQQQNSDSNSQDQENKDQEQQEKQDKQQQEDEQKQDPREEDTPPDQQEQEQEKQQQQQQQQQDSQLTEEDLQAQDLTKEQAKNILNAMKEDEKESMKKLILSQAKRKKIKRSKEW